jgi:ABC-2 type transport system ATP-binding protein
MSTAIVQLSTLSKSFGSQSVLRALDWDIAPGKVIGLLGRNGAGKSTLMECMLGLREIDGGSATLFGERADNLSDLARARIGYVPQSSDLFEWLTPIQMLDYFKALYPRWNTPKVDGLMARWGFDGAVGGKAISKLSGGEKQRLSIIRALAHDPELLILDEPVASLDPVGRREFLRELINGLIEHDTTVVFSTHILSDLERVAFDIAFLKDGRIALQGALDQLMESAHRISGPGAILGNLRISGEVRRSHDPSGSISVVARSSEAELAALHALQPSLRVESLNLEELFVEVTQ